MRDNMRDGLRSIVIDSARNPIQAKAAHDSVGDHYGFVSTSNILNVFSKAGWQPVSQQVVKPRSEDRHGYQKHLIRLEHTDFDDVPGLDGNAKCRPQLLVLNSHDKASSLRLSWGLWRLVCKNGLMMGSTVGEFRLNHSLYVEKRLPNAIEEVLRAFPKLIEQSVLLRDKQLSANAIRHYVKTMYDARLANVKNIQSVEYKLPLERLGDRGNDAFTIFNRVQERVMRGGINYVHDRERVNEHNIIELTRSSRQTRAVTAIAESVRLNRLAYDKALELV